MRLVSLICLSLGALLPLSASPLTWHNKVDEALLLAEKEKKSVYLNFSGSDWCTHCRELSNKVLESKEFKKLADKNLILVNLDLPQDNSLPPEQVRYNKKEAEKYGVTVYPMAFLLDSNGEIYWKRTGGAKKSYYIAELKEALKSKTTIMENLASAKQSQGEEKAVYLYKAYQAMSLETQNRYDNIPKEIIRLDTNDTLGLRAKQANDKVEEEQELAINKYLDKEVLPLLKKGEHISSLTKIYHYMNTHELTILSRQRLYQIMVRINVDMGEIEQAVFLLEKVVELDPKSPDAEKAKASIKALKQ